MNRIIAAAAWLLVFGGSHAMAQTCTGTALTSSQITSLLTGGNGGRYACIGTSPNAQWNELHTGGNVLDYKRGLNDPVDPSDTPAHPTGTYTIVSTNPVNSQAPGTIAYTYGPLSYTYTIYATGTGTIPYSNPGTYAFCGSGGAPTLLVTVSKPHC